MLLPSLSSPVTHVTLQCYPTRPTPVQCAASASCSARPEARIRIAPTRSPARRSLLRLHAPWSSRRRRCIPCSSGGAGRGPRARGRVSRLVGDCRAPWLSLARAAGDAASRSSGATSTPSRPTCAAPARSTPDRADSIAQVAVREAYHRRIPPALVLGVMLTENDRFKRNARSKVGALGLMQIMPRLWMPNLGPILGTESQGRRDEPSLRRLHPEALRASARRTRSMPATCNAYRRC